MKAILKKAVVVILTWQAKTVLKKYKPCIVAVTGSVGKTSTKDAIFTVLSQFYYVRKSDKSFNSEIGVPLTVLGCPNGWNDPAVWLRNIIEGFALILLPNHYPKWLVLEIGADRPGDIEMVTKWVIPDIAVITRLSKVPVHVEYFENAQAVFKEKAYLAKALKRDGVLILNADDEDVLSYTQFFEGKTILYGTASNCDVLGSGYGIEYGENKLPQGVVFNVAAGGESAVVKIKNGLGVQQMYPALAAIAVGVAKKLDLKGMAQALLGHRVSRGRMKILSGIKGSILIDDTYNSSPVATHEALNTLEAIQTPGKKIAMLGDMLELGIHSTEEHKKIGERAAKIADKLFTVGVRSRFIAEGALNNGMPESNIFQYEDSRIAGKDAEHLISVGDIVLIKGSQGTRMERSVEELLLNPLDKEKLLVRQDKEWKGR